LLPDKSIKKAQAVVHLSYAQGLGYLLTEISNKLPTLDVYANTHCAKRHNADDILSQVDAFVAFFLLYLNCQVLNVEVLQSNIYQICITQQLKKMPGSSKGK
jgi:hypothetical protein